MDSESTSKSQNTIIDFIYKDTELITSYYSQLFNGCVNSISRSSSEKTSEVDSCKVDIKLANFKSQSDETFSQSSLIQSTPADYTILELLTYLDLSEFDYTNLNKISFVKGAITLRDFNETQKAMNLFNYFDLPPELSAPLIKPKVNGKKNTLFDFIKTTLNMMDKGVQVELIDSNGHLYSIVCKENCFSIPTNNLINSYGTTLPSIYTTVGIIEKKSPSLKSKSLLKKSIDEINTAIYDILNKDDELEYVIKPLVIYKSVNF